MLAESFVVILKFVARPSFCVPPPERQAANRWLQLAEAHIETNNEKKMGKILCTCGQIIVDQSDFIKNKARIIADQDYVDFFEDVENNDFIEMTRKAKKYFNEVFQCDNCNSLIIFKQDKNKKVFFRPENDEDSSQILRSYLGNNWLGTMSANFTNGQGEIFWTTNFESGFRQNLSLIELKEFYKKKFKELSELKILRCSFLKIDNKIEHKFGNE